VNVVVENGFPITMDFDLEGNQAIRELGLLGRQSSGVEAVG
jgi:hypothetical protein